MIEEWKPLIYGDVDFSDRFLISNCGRVYSIKSQKILKQWINPKGYCTIVLTNGSRKDKVNVRIHRAVAYAFVPNPYNEEIVHHKDSNKLNNVWTNLEWTSNYKNVHYALDAGLLPQCKKIVCNETNQMFSSITDATKWCGLSYNSSSLRDYLLHPEKRTYAGHHPVTKERLTWSYAS